MIISFPPFAKHKKVLVECDFKASTQCKNQYWKLYKNVLLGRANNNDKDRCCFCFNSLTKTGANNFNFKYKKHEQFFKDIDSELKAYLLGFIAGDGHLKKDGLHLENHIIDIDVLELFRSYIAPQSNYQKHSDPERGKNTICLKIFSVRMVSDLLRHLKLKKAGKKTDKIQLPDLPDDLLWAFVRGLFDSDGTVATLENKKTSPSAGITSTSKQMQRDLMSLFDRANIDYSFNESNSTIFFGGYNCLAFLDKIYEGANYFLMRKRALWKIWKTWKPFYGTLFRPRKVRTYYPPISEKHRQAIIASNKKRKGRKYVRS